MIPFDKIKTITLDHGELVYFEPSEENRPSRSSYVGVCVYDNAIQIGSTRVSREAWEHILDEYNRCPFPKKP